MLYKTKDGWKLAEHTVIYSKDNKQHEKTVGEEGKEWWITFAEKWDNTEIVEFTDLHYTEEQLARLQDIQSISEGYMESCEEYVINGVIPDNIEPFKIMRLEKEIQSLKS